MRSIHSIINILIKRFMKIKRFKVNALSAEGHRQKKRNAIVGGSDSCRWGCNLNTIVCHCGTFL